MSDSLGNNSCLSFFIEPGILFQKFETTALTWEVFQRSIQDRSQLINGKYYPAMMDLRALQDIERSVRQILDSAEATYGLSACALIVDNPVSRFLGDLIMTAKAKKIPTKVFYREEEAKKWLEKETNT